MKLLIVILSLLLVNPAFGGAYSQFGFNDDSYDCECSIDDSGLDILIGYEKSFGNFMVSPEIGFNENTLFGNLLFGFKVNKVNIKFGAGLSSIEGKATTDSIIPNPLGPGFITNQAGKEFEDDVVLAIVKIEYKGFTVAYSQGDGSFNVREDVLSGSTIVNSSRKFNYDVERINVGYQIKF